MATATDAQTTDRQISEENVIMSGMLTKQGGSYRNWKTRHFILTETTLHYYKTPDDPKEKGSIDLTTGRGIRTMKYTQGIEWPDDVKANYAFAIATENRTYYMYGTSSKEIQKWKRILKDIIDKHGKPTDKWEEDVEGKPEHVASKIAKKVAKMGSVVTKKLATQFIPDENIAAMVEGAAEIVENQADADRNATFSDRLKQGAGDTAGVVGTGVQFAADYVPDEIGQTVVYTAGGIIHDQGKADVNASIAERITIGLGSTAAAVGDRHEEAEMVTQVIESGAEMMTEMLEEDRQEREEEEKRKKLDEDSEVESEDEPED